MKEASLCTHLDGVAPVIPLSFVCEDCQKSGQEWHSLRMCLICGYVGCGDDSPAQHAKAHALDSHHAVITSMETGEDWRWCYLDRVFI